LAAKLLRYEKNPLPVGMNFFPSTNGHVFLNGSTSWGDGLCPLKKLVFFFCPTVDGSEIRRLPVDMENIPLFTGFYTFQVVVWDFFHQQYQPPST